MMKARLSVAFLFVTLGSGIAHGEGAWPASRAGWHVHEPTRFVVSGVLRKNGSTDVIKPIHSIIEAPASDVAQQEFERSAMRQYPGYTLLATVVSRVPKAGTCESSI